MTHSPITWTTFLRIAYRNTNGGCWYTGLIEDISLYNRALNAVEISNLFSYGG